MNEQLSHIINTLKTIDQENKDSEQILEALNFVVNLLNNCDPRRLTKTYISRSFRIKRLTLDVKYNREQ